MAQTVLQLIQRASLECGFGTPSSAYGSTDLLSKQLLVLLEREGRDLRTRAAWSELTKETTISIVAAQDSYALPGDFDYFLFDTQWDRNNQWPLNGPFSPQEWQTLKSGIVAAGVQKNYRVKGSGAKSFFIDPVPSASDAGSILAYEYQSRSWLLPPAWTASTQYLANGYCSYDGCIFYTPNAGTSGSSAPTPSSLSDGVITWTQFTGPYDVVLSDNDTTVLDEDVIVLGIMWRIQRMKQLEVWASTYADYTRAVKLAVSDKLGAQTLSIDGENETVRFGPQVPEGNW